MENAIVLFEVYGGSNSFPEIAEAIALSTGDLRPYSDPNCDPTIPHATIDICTRISGVLTFTLEQLTGFFGMSTPKETFPCGAGTDAFRVCGKFPEDPAESGDWLLVTMILSEDVPLNDPTYFHQYGFVFDADGDPNNNYQAPAGYANDYYQNTDRWYSVSYFAPVAPEQTGTWEVQVIDAQAAKVQFVYSAATALIKGNTIMLMVPLSEFGIPNPTYRVTAFRETTTPLWDWSGDFHPELDQPLESIYAP